VAGVDDVGINDHVSDTDGHIRHQHQNGHTHQRGGSTNGHATTSAAERELCGLMAQNKAHVVRLFRTTLRGSRGVNITNVYHRMPERGKPESSCVKAMAEK
jgi:hypothetical protein